MEYSLVTKPSKAGFDPQLARRERMEAIGELVKRIGHDYNNLFGIVIGSMGVLKEELADKPELDSLNPIIDDAESAGREGAELIACLLACVGNQILRTTVVQPIGLFETIINQVKNTLAENVNLDVALMPNPPAIIADLEKLNVSIKSLLDNALEAMPNGGTLRISSELLLRRDPDTANLKSDTDRFLVFSVSDSGEGIRPELLRRVFEPFFTTRQPARERGLGLSLAYGYALQSGGTLCIDGNPAGGVTARLWLPAATECDAARSD